MNKVFFILLLFVALSLPGYGQTKTGKTYTKHPKNPINTWNYKPDKGDYFDIISNSQKQLGNAIKTTHFQSFPVKCWIAPMNFEWQKTIRNSISDYNYFIPTIETTNSKEADIKITLSTRQEISKRLGQTAPENMNALGGCDYDNNNKLACFVLLKPQVFDDVFKRKVINHELGHTFGLFHSNNSDDLMHFQYPDYSLEEDQGKEYVIFKNGVKRPVDKLHCFTSRDINTLWLLYNQW